MFHIKENSAYTANFWLFRLCGKKEDLRPYSGKARWILYLRSPCPYGEFSSGQQPPLLRVTATTVEPSGPTEQVSTALHFPLILVCPRSYPCHILHQDCGLPARVASYANGLAMQFVPHVHGPHLIAGFHGKLTRDTLRGLQLRL